MAYRVNLTITVNGTVMWEAQILGNNEDFSNEELQTLGVNATDGEGYYIPRVEADSLCKALKSKCKRDVEGFGNMLVKDAVKGLFFDCPSWTVLGSYAHVYETIREHQHTDGVEFTISAG